MSTARAIVRKVTEAAAWSPQTSWNIRSPWRFKPGEKGRNQNL